MLFVLPSLIAGFLASAVLIIAIGAQNLFVLRQGLRREHVGVIVLFCSFSDMLLIALGVGGMGAFLAAIPQLASAATLAGAAFLTWYGIKALRRVALRDAMVAEDLPGITLGRALLTAAAFTYLNPHVYLDTMLLMGTIGSARPVELRPFFVIGAAAASFVWFASLGFGARLFAPVFARPVAWRVLDACVGGGMLVLAGLLVRHSVSIML